VKRGEIYPIRARNLSVNIFEIWVWTSQKYINWWWLFTNINMLH